VTISGARLSPQSLELDRARRADAKSDQLVARGLRPKRSEYDLACAPGLQADQSSNRVSGCVRRRSVPVIHKYGMFLAKVTAMDEHDILTNDSDDESAYRERATAILDEIAAIARTALRAAGISLDVFFIVPSSGDAILTLGAAISRDEWEDIRAVVSSLVRRSIGLEPSRCQEIFCAMTDE
jgi:hypothetical protein